MMKSLKAIDWKFWISLALNFVFVFYAGYFNLYEPKPEIRIDLAQKIEVLEVKEAVPGLKVQLNEVDLFEQKKSLSIITIRFTNTGVDISPDRFDDSNPFGIQFDNAEILDAKLLPTSSPYIRTKISPQAKRNQLVIPSFFFPQKEAFEVKVLLIHAEDESPKLVSTGSIAGIRDFPITYSDQQPLKRSFWSRLVDGSLWVHLIRFAIYVAILFVAIVLLVFCVMMPAASINNALGKRKRIKQLERFKKRLRSIPPEFNFVMDYFLKNSFSSIIITKLILEYREILDHPVKSAFETDLIELQNIAEMTEASSVSISIDPPLGRPTVRAIRDSILKNVDIKNRDEFERFKLLVEQFMNFLVQNDIIEIEEERPYRKLVVKESKMAKRQKQRHQRATNVQKSPETPLDNAIIEAVRLALPPQPWPQGTHKLVTESLGITKRMYSAAVEELIKRKVFKTQINGVLYDEAPPE